MHMWTEAQWKYLLEIYQGKKYYEIADMINEKFAISLTPKQVKTRLYRMGIRKGGAGGRYEKGHTPWNKGEKMPYRELPKSCFKTGHISVNRKEVGHERVNRDGYWEIKTGNPSVWKLKHRVIYEEHYGEIPYRYAIIFLDGNKKNLNPENLAAVSQAELLKMNYFKLFSEDPEITKTGIMVARLMLETSKKEREYGHTKMRNTESRRVLED